MENSPMLRYALGHDWATIPYKRMVGANFGLAWKILQYTSKEDVNLIHVHDSHSLNAWLIAQSLGMKTPAILHRRADFPVGQHFFSRLKYNHPSIKKVICVSEQVRQVMLPVIKDGSKLEVVYDAVDYANFHDATEAYPLEKHFPPSAGKLKIATIAALVGHKDIPTFIKMVDYLVNDLEQNNMHFFIIGEGILGNELEMMIKEKGLQSHISLTGFIDEMPALMQSLDAYVFTSSSEAFGSTILEALSAGLPVVATETGAGKEILQHAKDAMIANISDYKSLAQHLLSILEDQNLRNSLVGNGLQTAQSFRVDRYAKQMEDIYLSCINGSNS